MRINVGKTVRNAWRAGTAMLCLGLLCALWAGGFSNKVYALDTSGDLCLISSAEDFAAFAAAVESGETFEGKTVLLTSSFAVDSTISVSGKFSGAFEGLGNTLTLAGERTAPLFEELSGAYIEDLTLSLDGVARVPDSDPCFAIFADTVENSTVSGCFVSGNLTLEISVSEPEAPEDSDTNGTTEAPDTEGTTEIPDTDGEPDTPDENTPDNDGADVDPNAPVTQGANSQRSVSVTPVLAIFAKSAGNSSFYGCSEAVLTDAPVLCLAYNAEKVTFSDIRTQGITEIYCSSSELVISDLLTLTPIEGEGVVYFDGSISAQEAVAALNESQSSPEWEGVWQTGETSPELHKHSYEEAITEKTCTAHETIDYICPCGKNTFTRVNTEGGFAEHTPSDEGTVVEPTCTEEGYTAHVCSVCGGDFKSDTVEAKGHKKTVINKKDSNCVEKGYTGDTVCTVCDELISKGTTTKKTSYHFYMRTEVTKEPTADEEGEITFFCQYCDATKTEVLPRHVRSPFEYEDETNHKSICSCGEIILEEHDFTEVGVVREPTADDEGAILYKCTVCMGTKEIAIPALGHTLPTEWEPYDEDEHSGICSCGQEEKQAHEWGEGVIVSDGIEDGTGEETTLYECTVCSYQKVELRLVELPPEEMQAEEDNSELVQKIAVIALAVLVIGGIGGYAYIKFTERK